MIYFIAWYKLAKQDFCERFEIQAPKTVWAKHRMKIFVFFVRVTQVRHFKIAIAIAICLAKIQCKIDLVHDWRSDPDEVIFVNESIGFGYLSNGEVNEQYQKCMMKGEFARICDVVCAKNKDHDSSTEDAAVLEAACDQCRGEYDFNITNSFSYDLCDISYTI